MTRPRQSANLPTPTTTESLPIQKAATATGTYSPLSVETASLSISQVTSEDSTSSTSDIHTSTAKSSLSSVQIDTSAPSTSVIETISDHIATAYSTTSNDYTKGYNITETEPATTVTTVVYTTVNPHKPGCLTTTEIEVTVGYTPCNCAHLTLPPVDMTTVVVPCQSCGPHGENSISLTIPAAVCETGADSTGKSHYQPKGDSHG
ncbi:hypothetical protein BKA59DRAFT_530820 [Fusarium tricinctum]|uniref:Uncharacterized protein n=1 Tax=Fusarium tricinctum TaxID=61284 RepID=A0A8K0RTI5_9HYPO|nr:hypothetical protein BKA59DRAFT_530820 [Fusarium tricinctum]